MVVLRDWQIPHKVSKCLYPFCICMAAGINCEGTQSVLQCGGDEVLNIETARYGRFDSTTCPHSAINGIDCESPDTYDVIRSLCQNKGSCTVTSSTSQFSGGDPCPGTHKYLIVTYTCQYQRKCPLLIVLSSTVLSQAMLPFRCLEIVRGFVIAILHI